MFQKLVAIEPVSLVLSAEKTLYSFADEVVMYSDIPAGDNEIIARIGDADAVLLSYTSQINRYILERCPNVRYIGMCCSLYSPESANVDIRYANERGITVTGIRDYGDEGVIEYVVSELVRCLHGFGQKPWEGIPREIIGLKVGIVGLGKSGGMIADAMKFFGNTYEKGQVEAGNYDEGQRNSFLFSMLVTASYIIRADGRIMHSEMEYVRQFLRMNFGEEAVIQGEQILLNLFEQRKQMERQNPMAFKNTIHECGAQIAANLPYEQRLQLLDFLVNIAKSDGSVCSEEIAALKEVAQCMELSPKEVESMLNLSGNSLEEAYKVLEIDPSATNEEVRTAYRRLALKHHPDRVATLGEDVKKAAEEKFQQINNAKERIYKARGIK